MKLFRPLIVERCKNGGETYKRPSSVLIIFVGCSFLEQDKIKHVQSWGKHVKILCSSSDRCYFLLLYGRDMLLIINNNGPG